MRREELSDGRKEWSLVDDLVESWVVGKSGRLAVRLSIHVMCFGKVARDFGS